MTDSTVEARVAQGAAWLDTNFPGWERVIDLATLDLADGGVCILGQIGAHIGVSMGCYVNAKGRIFGSPGSNEYQDGFSLLVDQLPDWSRKFGFLRDFDSPNYDSAYAELDAAWTSLIKERFGSGTLSDEVAA